MKRGIVLLVAIVAICCGRLAWAGPHQSADDAVPDAKSPKPQTWTITISAQEKASDGTHTACPTGYWAGTCPSGNCYCYPSTGTVTASSSTGKGTVTVEETYDDDYYFDTGTNGYCDFAAISIEITGKKDTEEIACVGADCYASDLAPTEYVSGGCGLTPGSGASKIFTTAEGGGAGSYGAEKNGSYPFKFTITGTSLK